MERIIVNVPANYPNEKRYISDLVFREFLGLDYDLHFDENISHVEITTNQNKRRLVFPEILFSFPESEWLTAATLPISPLRVRNLSDLSGTFFNQFMPVLYGDAESKSVDLEGDTTYFDIDLIGSIFFCVTLYDEVAKPERDHRGRFPRQYSTLYLNNLHQRAIANEYLEVLWHLMNVKFSGLKRKERKYKLAITHDIDRPLANNYAFVNFLKSCSADIFLRRSPAVLAKRIYSKIVTAKNHLSSLDPHNSFKYIMDVSERYGLKSEFNFIVINGKGSIDGSYDIETPFFMNLIKNIHQRGHIIGIHPSYHTFANLEKTACEFKKIRKICETLNIKQEEWGGRQHYLRWINPESWSIWEQIGATYDSSVGWYDTCGFRAGICYDYQVFDLKSRKVLQLKERPLIVMDLSAIFQGYKVYSRDVLALNKVCKYFNGEMVVLYHNDYFITNTSRSQYEKLIDQMYLA